MKLTCTFSQTERHGPISCSTWGSHIGTYAVHRKLLSCLEQPLRMRGSNVFRSMDESCWVKDSSFRKFGPPVLLYPSWSLHISTVIGSHVLLGVSYVSKCRASKLPLTIIKHDKVCKIVKIFMFLINVYLAMLIVCSGRNIKSPRCYHDNVRPVLR